MITNPIKAAVMVFLAPETAFSSPPAIIQRTPPTRSMTKATMKARTRMNLMTPLTMSRMLLMPAMLLGTTSTAKTRPGAVRAAAATALGPINLIIFLITFFTPLRFFISILED